MKNCLTRVAALLLPFFATSISACELCAIYSASNARGESASGFLFTVAEQFTSFGNLQFEGAATKPASAVCGFADGWADLSPALRQAGAPRG